MNITKLKLDSEVSGRAIGKCIFKKPLNKAGNDLILKFKEYDLVYFLAKFDHDVTCFLGNFNSILADIKITLSGNVQELKFTRSKLSKDDFSSAKDVGKLVQLGLDLYKESRFFYDMNTHKLGKKIYKAWIENSVNRSMADEILVRRDENGRVIGFVTVAIDGSFAEPVLVKIDESFTRKGYGRILMNKFFTFISDRDPDIKVRIHTQLRNLAAILFYQSFGLKVSDYDFVYHVYPNGFMRL